MTGQGAGILAVSPSKNTMHDPITSEGGSAVHTTSIGFVAAEKTTVESQNRCLGGKVTDVARSEVILRIPKHRLKGWCT